MKKFRVYVHEYDCNLLAIKMNDTGFFTPKLGKLIGFNQEAISENDNGHFRWAMEPENALATSRNQFDIYFRDRKRIGEMKRIHFHVGKEMFAFLQKMNEMDLSRLSEKELGCLYKQVYDLDSVICESGFSFVLIDFVDNYLTDRLEEILKRKASEKKFARKSSDYFFILTQPEEDIFSAKEKEGLYSLALKLKAGKTGQAKREKMVDDHFKKYRWITYGLSGPPLTKKFFEEELKDLLANPNLKKEVALLTQKKKKIVEERKKALKELGLDEDERYLFDLAREILLLKGYRKEVLVLSYYLAGLLVKELAKLTHLPFNLLRFLTPEELFALFEGSFKPSLEGLQERKKYLVYFSNVKGTEIMVGKKARDFFKQNVEEEKVTKQATELKGSIASPGLVKGIVKIINTAKDMSKMEQGNILVSQATQPELLPAIKKAAAIITDVGGMTCHAAIVSRELGVPCVIGTKIATQVLKDGDVVEVDASHGRVKKVK